jgi:hypothetical protein
MTTNLQCGCAAAADRPNLKTVQWLLEHGGADIEDATPDGWTMWDNMC